MITSKHASLIVLAGLLGTVLTQQGCGSDSSGPTGPTTAGSSGAPATGTAGAPVGGGGMTSSVAGAPGAGAPSAGAPAGGSSAAGSSAGGSSAAGTSAGGGSAGGSSAGTGGTGTGGTGGGSAGTGTGGGSAGMGGSSPTFAAVKTLFGASCGVGQCHNAASKNLDYQGTHDLHGLLTKPIPTGIDHCVGTTLVTPNDTNSFLVTVVKMSASCPTGGGNPIGKMPDNCGQAGKPACLTDTQIKVITDWISAGAPN